jgi:hypothetical protein
MVIVPVYVPGAVPAGMIIPVIVPAPEMNVFAVVT